MGWGMNSLTICYRVWKECLNMVCIGAISIIHLQGRFCGTEKEAMIRIDDLWSTHRKVFDLIDGGLGEEAIALELGWDLDVVQRIVRSRMGLRKRGIEETIEA